MRCGWSSDSANTPRNLPEHELLLAATRLIEATGSHQHLLYVGTEIIKRRKPSIAAECSQRYGAVTCLTSNGSARETSGRNCLQFHSTHTLVIVPSQVPTFDCFISSTLNQCVVTDFVSV